MTNFERASEFLRLWYEGVIKAEKDCPCHVFSRDFYRDVVRKQGVGE